MVLAVPVRSAYVLSRQARDVLVRCTAFIPATFAAANSTEYRALLASNVTPQ